MAQEVKNKTPIIATVVGVVALVVGYVLGATIGFGGSNNSSNNGSNGDSKPKWVGIYTNDTWGGHDRVSITLNADGTCKRPSYGGGECTYEVKDDKVYFNGYEDSYATLGDTGLVYNDHLFVKLK